MYASRRHIITRPGPCPPDRDRTSAWAGHM